MTDTLLVEVRTEELPPPAVPLLARLFPRELLQLLAARGFADANTPCSEHLATPRRFAALIPNVRGQTESQNVKRRGPQLKDCYDNAGKPSAALRGFLRAVGETDADKLARENENGRDYIVWHGTKPGVALGEVLEKMVLDSLNLASAHIPTMRWNDADYAFIRPVRGLIMMLGKSVIKGEVMGAISGDKTRGHPALSNGDIAIASAGEYVDTLREAKVIAAYNEREGKIYREVHRKADALDIASFYFGGKAGMGENEQSRKAYADSAAICEYPSVYPGAIDKEFRHLPEECVRSCLITHQKCLPFITQEWGDTDKKAHARIGFFFVADNAPDKQNIINGVNAVVRARLRDISFYLGADKKMTEQEAREKLGGIVYHRKLGSQQERAERIVRLAAAIGKMLKLNDDESAQLRRAAEVCKLDLPTMMVGEYPELAGTMAAIYFWEKWQIWQIAAIVKRHGNDDFNFYLGPDSAELPSVALFLADKLEKVVGMFVIGEKPAGRKDPHGLRRAAGQIAGMLAPRHTDIAGEMSGEVAKRMGGISITQLIKVALEVFGGKQNADIGEVREFIIRRISLPGIKAEVSNAVYALPPDYLDYLAEIPRRCKALQDFLHHPQAAVLIAANKRINNILRKSSKAAPPADAAFSPALLREEAEKALYECITRLEKETKQLTESGDYQGALALLAKDAAAPIGAFFDNCMVNAEDAAIRDNRLALLVRLRGQLNIVADLSHI